jgi:hypothetical protein
MTKFLLATCTAALLGLAASAAAAGDHSTPAHGPSAGIVAASTSLAYGWPSPAPDYGYHRDRG